MKEKGERKREAKKKIGKKKEYRMDLVYRE